MKAFKYLIFYIAFMLFLIIGFGIIYSILGLNLENSIMYTRIYIILILGLIFIPVLINKYRKYNIKSNKIEFKYILLIITLSVIYNIFGFYLNKYLIHSNLYELGDIKYGIISTVLIGPIIEELIFRGIMYNELKTKYSINKSIFITTTIFSLMHLNIIQIIYAFILGYILNKMYEKRKNIIYCILLHMISNLTTTIICLLII